MKKFHYQKLTLSMKTIMFQFHFNIFVVLKIKSGELNSYQVKESDSAEFFR